MKKLLLGMVIWALTAGIPVPAWSGVDIHFDFPLPPPIVFRAPPDVIVLPDTDDVYVAPDLDVDIFFWDGWWWRPYDGGWYRSNYYDRGWSYYGDAPDFYFDVDPNWRRYYKERRWDGHRWRYERVHHRKLKKHWNTWHKKKHWRDQRTWGVRDYRPTPDQRRQELRRQRQEQYQQRPEVRRHYQEKSRRQKGESKDRDYKDNRGGSGRDRDDDRGRGRGRN